MRISTIIGLIYLALLSQKCDALTLTELNQCINEGEVDGWYNGDSFNATTNEWHDLSNSASDALIEGSDIGAGSWADSSHELYLNGQSVVYGTPATEITFGTLLSPAHTVFNLCKYRSVGSKKRILTAQSYNGLFGFWAAKSGVAYEEGWITDESTDHFGTDWVLSSQTPASYRANGIDYTVTPRTAPDSTQLTINAAHWPNELSDFACAEVILVDQTLNTDEIQCIEAALNAKYSESTAGTCTTVADCGSHLACVNGVCQRDCTSFIIDDFLNECSTDYPMAVSDIGINAADIVTNAGDISQNSANISENAGKIVAAESRLTANIGEVDARLGQNISGNTDLINSVDTRLSTAIAVNEESITGNGNDISNNAGGISNNAAKIGTNAVGIATNVQNITDNGQNIATNVQNITDNGVSIQNNGNAISVNAGEIANILEIGHIARVTSQTGFGNGCEGRFSINFDSANGDILFHFNIRGPPYTAPAVIVENTRINGNWGSEQRTFMSDTSIPGGANEPFKIDFEFKYTDTKWEISYYGQRITALDYMHRSSDSVTSVVVENCGNNDIATYIDGTEYGTNIATNDNDISSNAFDISANANAINSAVTRITINEADIGTNVEDIATNADNISSNANGITANTNAINAAVTRVSANEGNISTNGNNIATNAADIAANVARDNIQTGQIQNNAQNISVNRNQKMTNAEEIEILYSKFAKFEAQSQLGHAMSEVQPNVTDSVGYSLKDICIVVLVVLNVLSLVAFSVHYRLSSEKSRKYAEVGVYSSGADDVRCQLKQ